MIADRLRPRDDLRAVSLGDDAAVARRLPVGRREDPVVDQTRRLTRLRHLLASTHPGLERAPAIGGLGPLVPLTRFVGADEIRSRAGGAGAACATSRPPGSAAPARGRWPSGP